MNTAGATFKLGWNAPDPADQVDYIEIFEHVGTAHNLVQTEAQPNNVTTLSGISPGVHVYAAKAHNVAGESVAYSNEVSVTVLALPATVTNLAFVLV